jgi:predicted permease
MTMSLDLTAGIGKIITIVLLIGVGFLARKKNIITAESKKSITDLVLGLIIPIAVFNSFLSDFDWEKLRNSLVLLLIALVYYPILQFVVSKIFFGRYPKDEAKRRLFQFGITYSNAVFMGLPFAQALFGSDGLFYASVFNLPYNVYLWSMGYAALTRQPMDKKGIKNTFTNPVIIACLLGYLYWLVSVLIPDQVITALAPVFDVFATISGANTPMSMILIGAIVAEAQFIKMLRDKDIWIFSLVKLIVVPGLLFGVLYALGFRGWIVAVPTVIAAMPACATGGILAAKFDIQKELSASIITFTTMLSALTAPIWLLVLLATVVQ